MTHHHRALILVITLLAALTTLCAFPSFSHHALLIAILTPPLALAGIHALLRLGSERGRRDVSVVLGS